MKLEDLVFVGAYSHVVALQKQTGKEVWRCKLKGGLGSGDSFVALLVEGNLLYAHSRGKLYCLEATSGRCLWENGLRGLGYGFASIAVEGRAASPQEAAKMNQLADFRSSAGDG